MIGSFQTSKSFNIREREYGCLWPVIKIGKVFTSKFVGTGPSSYEKKRIYRAAFSQRLRNAALYLSSSTRFSYQKDKRARPGNHPKSTAFRKSGSTEQSRTSTVLKELINTAIIHVACQRKHSTQHLFRQFLIWHPILLRLWRYSIVGSKFSTMR
jgi:hypothetical protein